MTHTLRVFLRNTCFRLVSGQTHLSHTEQVTTNFEGLLKGQCPAMVACYRSIIKSLGKSATVMWTLTLYFCVGCVLNPEVRCMWNGKDLLGKEGNYGFTVSVSATISAYFCQSFIMWQMASWCLSAPHGKILKIC